MNRKVSALLCLVLLLSGCSKYGYVRLNYPTPALVTLPENIKSIALVNRSLTRAEDKQAKSLEAVFSGEVAGSDKVASDECLRGVFDRINGWHQLRAVIPAKTRLYGTGTNVVPELLNWKLVQQICDSNNTDALLVLETFDSNSDVVASVVSNGISDILNGKVPVPSPPSQIKMQVVSFWRLYDPSTKQIVDEFRCTNYLRFDAGPQGFAVAPPDALPQTAYAAGQQYIERFFPGYYTVSRSMYKLGKNPQRQQFKAAFRRSEVANWAEASDMWKQLEKEAKRVNAGRACVNIAVAYEVLGKHAEAYNWARQAYEDYGNKLGRDYANKLKYRISIE